MAIFGRSDQLRVGDVVLAIGNPIGLSQTVTHGIVSATSRQQLGIAPLEDFIQTDAPINFGNSGGALVDSSGALVGINTAIVAKNIGVEGIGFAIPVNMVRGVLSDIIAHGRVIRGWIGIVPEDLPDEQAQQLGLAQAGVVIAQPLRRQPRAAGGAAARRPAARHRRDRAARRAGRARAHRQPQAGHAPSCCAACAAGAHLRGARAGRRAPAAAADHRMTDARGQRFARAPRSTRRSPSASARALAAPGARAVMLAGGTTPMPAYRALARAVAAAR